MLGHRGAVDRVVGGHDAPGVGLGDDGLEGGQVQLAQGAFGEQVVHREALGLGVVGDEVLDGGADAARLDALDIAGADLAGQVRVLAVRLEVAAAERRAVQVDGGREEDVDLLAAGLLGEQGARPAREGRVPGGGERGRRGSVIDGSSAVQWTPRTPIGPSDMTRGLRPISGSAGSDHMSCLASSASVSGPACRGPPRRPPRGPRRPACAFPPSRCSSIESVNPRIREPANP